MDFTFCFNLDIVLKNAALMAWDIKTHQNTKQKLPRQNARTQSVWTVLYLVKTYYVTPDTGWDVSACHDCAYLGLLTLRS